MIQSSIFESTCLGQKKPWKEFHINYELCSVCVLFTTIQFIYSCIHVLFDWRFELRIQLNIINSWISIINLDLLFKRALSSTIQLLKLGSWLRWLSFQLFNYWTIRRKSFPTQIPTKDPNLPYSLPKTLTYPIPYPRP